MAEFGMHNNPSWGSQPQQPPAWGSQPQPNAWGGQPAAPQQPQQPMEWYSTPAPGGPGGAYGAAGQYQHQYQYAPPPVAHHSAAYPSFDEEPPLLEELGIDIPSILLKTKAILLHQMRASCLDDLDFGGALVYLLALGCLHLLMGKMHFGVLLGWSVVQSGVLWFMVNQIASNEVAEQRPLDLYSCCCIVGYGMVPLLLLSVGALLIPRGPITALLAVLAAAWSAVTAAKILSRISHALADVQTLVMMPCFLLYGSFALLTVY